MWKYGQYCPLAYALEILGDRWTLLIIRDMMLGTCHFNDLERGLPGISRGLLSKRLQRLQEMGLVEKRLHSGSRASTEYHLTQAGNALQHVVEALVIWGAEWAFGDPSPEDLNSVLLMWWIHRRVNTDQLPESRVVVQFDFYGAETATYWLIMNKDDVALCLVNPGYETDVLVTADLATFFRLWAGRISYKEALDDYGVRVDGLPKLTRQFSNWFGWAASAPEVFAARQVRAARAMPESLILK